MLKELIHDKINEVFLEYQKANNIISGDIDPFDAKQLDLAENILAEIIQRVCDDQPRGFAACYTYETAEGDAYVKSFDLVGINEFFREVSNIIAFGDCTDYTVTNICFDNKEVEYVGWQFGMKYEYKDLNGNTVWVGTFPEWDH